MDFDSGHPVASSSLPIQIQVSPIFLQFMQTANRYYKRGKKGSCYFRHRHLSTCSSFIRHFFSIEYNEVFFFNTEFHDEQPYRSDDTEFACSCRTLQFSEGYYRLPQVPCCYNIKRPIVAFQGLRLWGSTYSNGWLMLQFFPFCCHLVRKLG